MKDGCIFCMIAAGIIPSETVYEDDDLRVVFDIAPAQKGHLLILPKAHADNVLSLPENISSKVLGLAARVGAAQQKALGAAGFNLVVNTGEAAGQTVMHFHMHVIPRYEGGESLLLWKPGGYEEGELAKLSEAVKGALS